MIAPAWPLMSKLCSTLPVFRSVMLSVPHGAELGVTVKPKSNMFTSTFVVTGFAHPPEPPELTGVVVVGAGAGDASPCVPDDVDGLVVAAADAAGVTLTPTPSRPFMPAPA